MKLTVLPAAILAVGVLYAQTTSQSGEGADVRIEMRTANGQSAGMATLTETPHGLIVRYTPFNLPRGAHAVHLHEKGACDGPSFESAGGHFNPARAAHGFASAQGYHAGDMPNIAVSGERETHEHFVKDVKLKSGGSPLIDGDGASLVVHAGADDRR